MRSARQVLVLVGIVIAVLLPATEASAFKTTGATVRHKDIPVASLHTVGATLRCPHGQVVVSGGAYWYVPGQPLDPSLAGRTALGASLPVRRGHAWYAAGIANDAMTLGIVVQCLPEERIGAYTINVTDFQSSGFPTAAGGYVACPVGQRIVTGGAAWVTPGDPLVPSVARSQRLSSSSPTLQTNGWYAAGNGLDDQLVLRVVAMCRPRSSVGSYSIATSTGSAMNGATVGAYLSCPAGTRIVAAGGFWHLPSQGPDPALSAVTSLAALTPTLDRKGSYAAAVSYSATLLEFTLVVECRP